MTPFEMITSTFGSPAIAGKQRYNRLPVHVLGKPRCRGRRSHERDKRQFGRGYLSERSVQFEHLGRLAGRPGYDAADHLRTDRVERVINAGHDAEVSPTTPQSPEEIWVLIVACAYEVSVGSHDIQANHVVRCPAPPPCEVAESSAEGESGDAGERNETEHSSEPVYLRFTIHVAKQATRLRVGDSLPWVHPYATHERHIEHQRAVSHSQACNVVSSALDAKKEVIFARELHARDHVRDAQAARDSGGPSVNHGVPDGAHVVVAGVTGK